MGRTEREKKKSPAAKKLKSTHQACRYGYRKVYQNVRRSRRKNRDHPPSNSQEDERRYLLLPFLELDLVFDNDNILYNVMAYLVENGGTDQSDSAMFARTFRVCKSWRNAFLAIQAQMRYDYWKQVIKDYARPEWIQDQPGKKILEVLYLPPLPLLAGGAAAGTFRGVRGLGDYLQNFFGPHALPPEGRLFIRCTFSWDEVRVQNLANHISLDYPEHSFDNGGNIHSYVPPCCLGSSFHVMNETVYDEYPRLIRCFANSAGETVAQEWVGPNNNYAHLECEARDINEDDAIEYCESLNDREQSEHRWMKLPHFDDNKCARFIGRTLPILLGSNRPTRQGAESMSPQLSIPSAPTSSSSNDDIEFIFPFVGSEDFEPSSWELDKVGRRRSARNKRRKEPALVGGLDALNGHLRICRGDVYQLSQGCDVSDTMVNFFMQWIAREDTSEDAVFLSSHFFTMLSLYGHEAISSKFEAKGFNIFAKRFVFIPLFLESRWSLCIIVNPGFIMNEFVPQERQSDEEDFPCIMHLCPENTRMRSHVADCIRGLLNFEFARIKTCENLRNPFNSATMEVFDLPGIPPRQALGQDGGLFVCCYANAFYAKRKERLTYEALSNHVPYFLTFVLEECPELRFNTSHIQQLRRHLTLLVSELSELYSRNSPCECR